MKTEPGIRSETTPSIRHDVTPFGYAIVDKNGEKKSCLIWFREELAELNECIEERDKMCPGGAPHRIVELYTKEQLDNSKAELLGALSELSDMYSHAWDLVDGGLMMFQDSIPRFEKAHLRADNAIKAAHGIVESSSGEQDEVLPKKGDV